MNCQKCLDVGWYYTSFFHPTHSGGPMDRIVEHQCDECNFDGHIPNPNANCKIFFTDAVNKLVEPPQES